MTALVRRRVIGFAVAIGCAACSSSLLEGVDSLAYTEKRPSMVVGGGSNPEQGVLYRPVAVNIDEQGQIYVLDEGYDAVLVFESSGEYSHIIGASEDGAGALEFGTRRKDRLLIGDGRVVVFKRSARRFATYTTDGNYVQTFSIAEIVEDAALATSGKLLVTPIRPGNPRIQVYGPDGLLSDEYGHTLMGPSTRNAALGNRAYVTSTPGAIVVTYMLWSMLDILDTSGSTRRVWLEAPWWDQEGWSQNLKRPASLLEDFALSRVELLADERLRTPLFADIEAVPGRESVVVLVQRGPVAQYFRLTDGRPEEAYKLLDPKGNILPIVSDIALNKDGTLLCAAPLGSARVYCYALNRADDPMGSSAEADGTAKPVRERPPK